MSERGGHEEPLSFRHDSYIALLDFGSEQIWQALVVGSYIKRRPHWKTLRPGQRLMVILSPFLLTKFTYKVGYEKEVRIPRTFLNFYLKQT
jgi:hypothetical protein